MLVVDAVGLRCPLPVIRLAAATRDAPAGTLFELRSSDPAAGPDVAAWCRLRGHDLLEQVHAEDGVLLSRVRVRAGPASAPVAPAG